jgi:hypothetical protein
VGRAAGHVGTTHTKHQWIVLLPFGSVPPLLRGESYR